MAFIDALALSEVQKEGRVVAVIDGHKILFLWHNNEVHAVQSQCPHLKLPLLKGTITERCTIICPFHKSEFDLHTGESQCWSPWPPVVGSLLGVLSKEKNLKVYPTQIEEDRILVDISQ